MKHCAFAQITIAGLILKQKYWNDNIALSKGKGVKLKWFGSFFIEI